jgi:hypothetical protein
MTGNHADNAERQTIMYTVRNFKTKKELKAAVEAWNAYQAESTRLIGGVATLAQPVTYFQPGPFGGNEPRDGTIYCEGPHYPKPHRWYAACEVKDGVIIKVR